MVLTLLTESHGPLSRYEQAAAQGNHFAQNNLGIVYKNGIAGSTDLDKAFEWFMKAAKKVHHILRRSCRSRECSQCPLDIVCPFTLAKDNANSQYWVGHFYENGWVVEQDLSKAVEW